MVTRTLATALRSRFFKRKVLLVLGARQVGKTTLIKNLADASNRKTLFLNCDEPEILERLQHANSARLQALVGDAEFVVIDEAQRVRDIGLTVKRLVDNMPRRQFVVSGSSALELSNSVNEPLTGRKYEFRLFPFSTAELASHTTPLAESLLLHHRLVHGFYPDVVNNPGEEREILTNLTTSYLYKDIFAFQDMRKPELLRRLLVALAAQIGQQVSFDELSRLLGVNSMTIRRYVDLLEKAFVIFHLPSFSRNVRNELKKSIKIYFYDNGIRNALLSNFNPPELRGDIGALWENFLVSERLKRNNNLLIPASSYFWRTTQQQEVDYIEESDGRLAAFEFKWNPVRKARFPVTFSAAYPDASRLVVTPDNFPDFVC
ncbi:MAG: ATP-binding protein [Opitutaceae bacterium]|jgi:predicted AAA+ superfamily ATPase|nr:ATP-binding protein [Opitutaceae bacterium]